MPEVDGIDFRPTCPACGRKVDRLALWGKGYVCPECATRPLPERSALLNELISAAAEAVEVFGEDELERYAMERRGRCPETPPRC